MGVPRRALRRLLRVLFGPMCCVSVAENSVTFADTYAKPTVRASGAYVDFGMLTGVYRRLGSAYCF